MVGKSVNAILPIAQVAKLPNVDLFIEQLAYSWVVETMSTMLLTRFQVG